MRSQARVRCGAVLLLSLCSVLAPLQQHAQQPASQQAAQTMGTVATQDALVTGGLEVRGDRANLMTNASITAYDRTAAIDLARGGEVLVCATSQFHLLHSGTGAALLFALDRGAVEIRSAAELQDVVITPDLRFSPAGAGMLDLRLRVTRGGDTCVENAGASAPVVAVTDAFTSASYQLQAGQHVLFEHGSLREVVDRESSPCGCPAAVAPATDVAVNATPAEAAAARHPFPAAVSEGLAPEPPVARPSPVAGEQRTQVSSTLAYGGNRPDSTAVPAPPAAAPEVVSTGPPPAPPGAHDLVQLVGHFFHRLFHRSGSQPSGSQPGAR